MHNDIIFGRMKKSVEWAAVTDTLPFGNNVFIIFVIFVRKQVCEWLYDLTSYKPLLGKEKLVSKINRSC